MRSYGMTHIGQKRSVNQDYIYVSDGPVGNLPNLYIVADGMGGHKAGDKASSFAVGRFLEIAAGITKDQPVCVMKDAICQVNEELLKLADSKEEYNGMGTTFVAASIVSDQLYVMNVGDSRLYLMNRELKQISMDHSFVAELVRNGELTKEEARNHPKKNYITRAIGAEDTVKPDFFQVDFQKGDRILLCSDGLSNMISDRELEQILRQGKDVKDTVEALVDRANEAGGMDNIAVVIAESEER